MSAKVVFLLALAAVAAKCQESNNICDCDMEEKQKEKALLWDLLSKFAAKLDGGELSVEEGNMYATSPGLVSPLLRCECMENNRKKRKIFPETAEEIAEDESEDLGHLKTVQFDDRRCPTGYARVGVYCFELAGLE